MSYADLASLIESADAAEARGDLAAALELTRAALALLDELDPP